MSKVKLGDICTIRKGTKIEPIDQSVDAIRFIQIDDLRNNDNIKYCELKKKYVIANPDNIIIAWDGANAGTIGFGLSGAIGSTLATIRLDSNNLATRYVGLLLRSKFTYLRNNCTGATIPHINRKSLENIKIPLYSLERQNRIAKSLDTTAELLAMRKQQLAELNNLIKSTFYDMFGDPVSNEKGWNIVSYSSILTEKPQNGFFAKNDVYSEDGNSEVIWLSDFIDKMYCNLSNLKKVNATEKGIKNYGVVYGDMLFCRSSLTKAGIGKCSYVPREVRKNTLFECHVIKTKIDLERINPIFLQVQTTLDYFRNQIISNSKTSTMTTISQEGIVKNLIILPPLSCQNRFAEIVTEIEEQKSHVKKAIDETQYLFDSLMSEYFD